MGRLNFASDLVGDLQYSGIQQIVQRLTADGSCLTPEELVDGCLELVGPLPVGEKTRESLLSKARSGGDARFQTAEEKEQFSRRVTEMLQLIVATREFQFA